MTRRCSTPIHKAGRNSPACLFSCRSALQLLGGLLLLLSLAARAATPDAQPEPDRELLVRLPGEAQAILPTWILPGQTQRSFCVEDLLRLDGALVDMDGGTLRLWARGHQLTLVEGLRFARLDGKPLHLAPAPRRIAEGLLVPESLLGQLFGLGLLQGTMDLAKGELELKANPVGLEREVVAGGELLRLRLPQIPVFESVPSARRLDLRLPNLPELAALTAPERLEPPASALVTAMAGRREGEDWVLSLDLSPDAELLDVEEVEALGEIQVLLRRRGAVEVAASLAEPAAAEAAQVLDALPVKGLREELRRIVIDAGHGGHDPGALSRWGRSEKDMTLAIARDLREQIRRRLPGVEVLLTRDSDTFLSLGERTRLANEARGQLFMSIHINAAKDRRARGHEVFLLRPGMNEHARQVALRENQVLDFDGGSGARAPADWILASMAQSAWAEESLDMAVLCSRHLSKVTATRRRPVQQAGFQVLVGASMPSVLVECGFISNAEDHRQLDSAEGRRRIALALCDAVVELHGLSRGQDR